MPPNENEASVMIAHTHLGRKRASFARDAEHEVFNSLMYWDGGHGDNEDVPEFIAWVGKLTGYTA